MFLKKIVIGMLGVNCYLVGEPDELLAIDPGGSADEICAFLDSHEYQVKHIVLTHCHFDHMLAANALKEKTGATIFTGLNEKENLLNSSINLTARFTRTPVSLDADRYVSDGDIISSGNYVFSVIETPGHTSGGVCLYCEDESILFSGDTLFCESVGRSDFPTGDQRALISSIQNKLFSLPEETRIFPGHGEETSIAHEKIHNPYI